MSGNGKQKAMLADSKPSISLTDIDKPKPGAGQVLVRVSHVAQNPTDGIYDL